MKSSFIDNQEITIEFIDSRSVTLNKELPLVLIPGLSESAEDYIPLMKLFSRRCIAISLRGRGKSDAPKTGYTLEDHSSDINAVIKHLELDEFILMGYSRGVSYALDYAFTNLHSVKGLILGDYPAHHTQLPPEWVEHYLASPPWRGKSVSERMPLHSIYGIQRESHQVLFWDQLCLIESPVLVIRGGKEGSALSILDGAKYVKKSSKVNLITFEESSHNIFEPSLERFVDMVEEFIENL